MIQRSLARAARLSCSAAAVGLFLLSVPETGMAGEWQPGFRDLLYEDTTRDRSLPVAVWYPTDEPAKPHIYAQVHNGQAAVDAAIAPGRHPLLLLSHGTGGNRFNQYYLGEFLARAGYVVAAVEHPGDRTFDDADLGTAKNLYNRPRDLSVALDALLSDPAVAPAIDDTKVGALGHSAGGFSVVVAAGGLPNLVNLLAYCRAQTEDSLTCPKRRDARLAAASEHTAFIEGGVSLKDSRIRVAAVFAPAIGPLFDAGGLAAVDIPVMVFWARHDELLNEPTNSQFYLQGLPLAVERDSAIGHFGFLSLCSDFLQRVAPQICVDPPGISRAGFHATLTAELASFLGQTLKHPEP